MNDRSGRALTFAAAGVIALIFPVAVLVPLLNLLLIAGFAAVHYLWLARRWTWLIQALLAAVALTWAWGGPPYALGLIIVVLIPGLLMTTLRYHRRGLALALLGAGSLPLLLMLAFHGPFTTLIASFGDQLKAVMQSPLAAQIYSPTDYQKAILYTTLLADNAVYYLPATLLASLLFVLAAGALLGEFLVQRQGIFVYKVPPFSLWKLDEWMVVPVGLAIILVLTKEHLLAVIGWNALLLLFLVFSIFGLAFVEYQMRVRGFPTAVKVVLYLFLFLLQFIAAILLPLIALFDAKFDFRKIRAKQLG